MKTVLLQCVIILSTINCFSQAVTYKDLIGSAWTSFDSSSATYTSYKFLDNMKMADSSYAPRYQPALKIIEEYSLNIFNDSTILNIDKYTGQYVPERIKYFIKLKDKDTLIIKYYSGSNLKNNMELLIPTLIMKRT